MLWSRKQRALANWCAVTEHLIDAVGDLLGLSKQGDTLDVHTAGQQLAFEVAQPQQREPASWSPLGSRG
jgi:hypothetical protein